MTDGRIIPTDKQFRDECDRTPWAHCEATHEHARYSEWECEGCPAWEGLKRRHAARPAKETP